jgi:adenylate cyclase
MEQLQPAVQRMCEAVESFGGTIVRTLGDGILAMFGVPHTQEGHARLACEAALALQRAFAGNQWGLQVRVGLHSGQVASDPQAFDSSIGGGVHGRAIHLASRVMGVAEPGGICLSAACLALTGDVCETQDLGLHTLRGIAEPTRLHTLLRMKSDAPGQRFHQAALSPLQGRARELAALQDALRRTEQGQCAVLGLSGAAGTGKSRLCFEFVRWCGTRLVPVTEVRAQLYGYATPLAPVLELLRRWFFRIAPTDDAVAARGRITARLARLGVAAGDDLALFHEFLGVADPDAAPCALAPKARRARLLELFGDMVRRGGATASVIVFEDLHWLDEASAEFLDVLVRSVPGTRTLVLFNYRPAYRPPWPAQPHFQEIHLAELGAADIEALVRELAGAHAEWQDVLALIVQRSAGNPFFAEELVRALQGDEARGPGAPSLAARLNALPATVQAVIGARIDRLGATQKSLLHICAVIGKEIPLPVLQQVALYVAGQIERELGGLCEAELLDLLREFVGERRFGFHHPLIQEVAYNSQLKARRASLHAAVAAAMEAHYGSRPDEFAALMAFHYEAAEQPAAAARHWAQAAQWLGATNSAQAMKCWRHARELLAGQPRAPETNRLRVRIAGGLLQLGWREGMAIEELNALVEEAVAYAGEADRGQVQSLLVTQGRVLHGNGGSADDYVKVVRRAIELGSPNPGRDALLHATLSQAYAWAGLLHEALVASDQAMPALASVDAGERAMLGFDPERWRLALRARVLMRMLRLDEAEECLRRMDQISADGEDPIIGQMAHTCRLEIAWCRRKAGQAERYLQKSAQVLDGSSPYSKMTTKWNDGIAALLVHDLERAERSLSSALELIRAARIAIDLEDELLAWTAECHALAGDLQRALGAAKQTVDLARQRSHRISECRGLIVWGTACAREGGDGARLAQQLFARAEQLIAETGAAICEDPLRRGRAPLAPPA